MDQQFPVAMGAQPLNPEVKKGRGRPKGSRNKPRPEGEVAAQVLASDLKRKIDELTLYLPYDL